MRKIVLHTLILLLSITYFTFSSGIYFTIHHCTRICQAYVTPNSCSCDHHHSCDTECFPSHQAEKNDAWNVFTKIPINFHAHTCHTTYFFKIIDFYNIAEKLTLHPWSFLQTNVQKIVSCSWLEPLFPILHDENISFPSFYHLQGNNFIDCLHQRIFYS